MEICFGFVMKAVLVRQGCFSYAEQGLHSAKACSAPHPAPPASGLGMHGRLGGDTARAADPSWPKGYTTPYGVILSNYCWRRRRRKRGDIWDDGVFPPKVPLQVMELCSPGDG